MSIDIAPTDDDEDGDDAEPETEPDETPELEVEIEAPDDGRESDRDDLTAIAGVVHGFLPPCHARRPSDGSEDGPPHWRDLPPAVRHQAELMLVAGLRAMGAILDRIGGFDGTDGGETFVIDVSKCGRDM